MADKSTIEWTDASWNPVRGCVKVSPGCKHCYAETFAERFRGVAGHPYEQGFDPRLVPEMLDQPLRWKKPRKIFVNSMSDLFGEFVPDEYIAACFGVMAACPHHTFQVLSKRAERLPKWFAHFKDPEVAASCVASDAIMAGASSADGMRLHHEGGPWPLPNVWLGVSVEDRKYGLPRIDLLRTVPAAVRWLSIEPLLEDVASALDLTGIQWVVVGGESGRSARPMALEWARGIRDVCRRFGVPFYFKQAGAYARGERPEDQPYPHNHGIYARDKYRLKLEDAKGGDLSELPEDLRIREFPTVRG